MVKIINNPEIEKPIRDFKSEHINKLNYVPLDYFNIPSEITDEEINNQNRIFKTKQEIVQHVLEGYELARNNDTVMELECLRTEFPCIEVTSGKDNIIFKFPRKWLRAILLTPFEDYRRCRQKLIADAIEIGDKEKLDLLLPTDPEVRERRIKKQKVLREYFRRDR